MRFLTIALSSALLCTWGEEPDLEPGAMPRVPPTEAAEVQRTFRVKPGFRMELVASEPLVMDPIAMAFDENGRLYVVEMRDYSERRDEKLGRIKLLEDLDGDGRMDKATVFAEEIPWPVAVFCYGGGVFVGSTPDILYFKDQDGDGVADERQVVFTGFGSTTPRLNVQAQLNSFTWGLDNRIHGASGGNGGMITSLKTPATTALDLRSRDFSFDPKSLVMRRESGGSQHGLTFDNFGRKFVCHNSSHIQQVMYEERYSAALPSYHWPSALLDIAVDGGAAAVYRISPEEPWRVIRTKWRVAGLVPGPIEGGGRASGYFTSATGVTIYRGDALGEEFVGDAFTADCGSNLIHRKKLRANGVAFSAERPRDEQRVEFVASTDNWFRPVQFANAPDGALYVADMYREVIEHPWSFPANIKKHLDLNSGNDRGRIYRIVPENFKQRPAPRLSKAKTRELVELLNHSNGWHRDTAARLLFERQDKKATSELRKVVKAGGLGRFHALYVMTGLQTLKEEDLLQAFSDGHPGIRENAIKLTEHFVDRKGELPSSLQRQLEQLVNDPDPRVRFQLACTLGLVQHPRKEQMLAILLKNSNDRWERIAGYAAASKNPAGVAEQLFTLGARELSIYRELARLAGGSKAPEQLNQTVQQIGSWWNDEREQVLLLSALGESLERSGGSLREALQSQRGERLQERLVARVASRPRNLLPEEINLLGMLDSNEQTLTPFLTPQWPVEIQGAVIRALGRKRTEAAAAEALEHWGRLTPAARQIALEAFSAHPEPLKALLKAVQAGKLQRGEIPVSQAANLRKHPDETVRQLASEVFGGQVGTRETALTQLQPALSLRGELQKGHELYQERCANCHRLGGKGAAVGPDLESVRLTGRQALFINILDPNREIAPRYLAYEVETRDGEYFSGVIASETSTQIVLRAAGNLERVIPRDQIVQLKNSGKSLMPEGLEEGLDPQGLADLLEYVLRGE